MNKPIRADVVGSLLRPRELLEAQMLRKNGVITEADLTRAEDTAVKDAVALQIEAGVDVVTDGEMRRPVFCHNFVKAMTGFSWDIPGNTVIWFDMNGKQMVDPVTVGVTKKIKRIHDISVDEFSFLRAITDRPKKITIPSPTMMSYYFVPGVSDRLFSPSGFLRTVTKHLHDAVMNLESIGVDNIQVDAPEFGMLLDPIQQAWFAKKGFNPNTLVKEGVDMINTVLSGFHGTTSLHICRGNDKNRFMARGGYDSIAGTVFQHANVDRLLLEFDSDRAGGFAPLAKVPKDKTVVLGLVTTKSPILENEDGIIGRIGEATRFMPIERLAISTQCGFASVAKGNNMSVSDEKRKLNLVTKVARKVWRD